MIITTGLIPARKAAYTTLKKGQCIKVINTYGKQVVDFWAFNPKDASDHLSMVHTRTVLTKVSVSPKDTLVSTRRQPMITLVEDTTPGIHDIIWSACDLERYRMLGAVGWHDNCSHNLITTLEKEFPTLKLPSGWIPDPLNLFMNVAIDHRGQLDVKAPVSEKGQYVVIRAEADVVVVMSACPQDMAPVNAGDPQDCTFEVLEEPTGTAHGIIQAVTEATQLTSIPAMIKRKPTRRIKVALSFDFDAVSHWLGTGCHPDNNMADYSSGIFAGQVGALRLVRLLKKLDIADKVTWFIPGHTMETFPDTVKQVLDSGAEIGLHGYAHEGISQMTVAQETDVLLKCIEVATKLCGKPPRGYRAPMYTIRETTVKLLREHKFLYDTSLMHHDSQLYFTPSDPPIKAIDFSQPASSWLQPTPISQISAYPVDQHPLVEIPCGWYNEDMMPLQYLPHLANSNGYVATRVIEQMWKDKFMWLLENSSEESGEPGDFVFPILMHPDTSGMAHITGMAERIMVWLKNWGENVEFCRHEQIATEWLEKEMAEFGKK